MLGTALATISGSGQTEIRTKTNNFNLHLSGHTFYALTYEITIPDDIQIN